MRINHRIIRHFDWALLATILLIPLLSLIVLNSAGYDPDTRIEIFGLDWMVVHSTAFLRQLTFLAGGLIVLIGSALIPLRFWQQYAYPIFIAVVFLLIAVALFGTITKGSQRWLSLGFYNLQPSELAKFAIILACAKYISKNLPGRSGYGFLDLGGLLALIGLPSILILTQPDLGTALAVAAIGVAMVLFIGIQPRVLAVGAALGAGVAALAWFYFLMPYQKRRILTVFNPEVDPQGSGWQITQSKIAVGSGELFGKGYMQGSQSQLEFLPERTTDFIFCVLAEEFGFLGCMLVLSLYFLLLAQMLRLVLKLKDPFAILVVVGVSFMLFFHLLVNVGMVIGFLPVVGLPLPLFSYGGSALISNLFCLGVVLGISMRRSVLFTS